MLRLFRKRFLAALGVGCLLVAVSCARGENRWPDERQAGQFLCHADFSLEAHESMLGEMAQLKQDVIGILGASESQEQIHVFLFQSKTSYQAYMKQYFPRVPYRRAMFIKARGPGMVFAFQGQDFEIDVRHESTHALLHNWVPTVPLWLDEGLAEYFEAPRDKRAAGGEHLATVRTAVRLGQTPRLAELEALQSLDEMGRDEYRDAWAWVHFMLHGPVEANQELLHYLDDLAAGETVEPLSTRLKRRMPDLERRLAEHFR